MLKNYLYLFLLIPLLGGVRGGSSFAQQNMTFLGNLPYTACGTVCINDVWGYVDTAGNEYALVGVGSGGVSVVDVTNPAAPTEVFFAAGVSSIWRDIKTWGKYAYITNENSGGLMIIDLSTLPSTPLTVTNYTGSGLSSAHNIFIDENGFAYLFGSNLGGTTSVILDLNIDPMAPVQVGVFSDFYIHDGMVRGDTLWAAHVSNGFFSAIDVSNKANPVIFNAGAATHSTPNSVTHNCWISDDGNTLFTTDEVSGAFITSYDVSNLSNITELDRIQSNPGLGVMPHNTHVKGDFLVNSYYKDGVTVVDASRPANMIQVGFYDTSPLSGGGSSGCWGAYPFLPSGNILASDEEEGLFVLGVNYVYACYLEGIVTDSICGDFLDGVTVEILTTSISTSTNLTGEYKFGTPNAGTYNIRFSKPGYASKTVSGVVLTNGILTTIDMQLRSLSSVALTGQVVRVGSGNPIPNVEVMLQSPINTYIFITDSFGNFSKCNIVPDNYEISAGKWNYVTKCITQFIDSTTSNLLIELDSGIYDDFTFDFGWVISGTAATGVWERGIPIGTDWISTGDANPGIDVSSDCSDFAYVTGNAGGSVGNDDVDDGNTVLTSPVFDLSSYACPFLNYYRWFFNDGGAGSPDDTLHVKITNGTTTVTIESVDASSAGNSSWVFRSFRVADYITPTATMQVIFETSDLPGSGHLVEAGVDKFEIIDSAITVDSTALVLAACGFADGIITIYAGGGTPPLEFSIDTGNTFQTSNTFDSLTAGVYSIIIRDFLNCTITMLAVVNNTAAPVISVDAVVNVSCNGYSNGSIQVSSIGGNPPYQYGIDGGPFQADSSFTGLTAGSYLITVKDATGCISSISQPISEPLAMITSISKTDILCFGSNNGMAKVTVNGGTMPYSYLWSDFSITDSISNLSVGTYFVTVTDTNGCTAIDSVEITEPALLTGNLSSTDESSSGASDGTASVSMSGGTQPYTYSWSPGGQTAPSISGLASYTYIVTVTDANGCTFIDSVTVNLGVGINELFDRNSNIKVYPNPFNESTQIEYKLYDEISTDAKMLITDLLGRFVNKIALTSQQGTVTINNELSEGIYFVRIINGKDFSRTVKLIKF